MITLNNIIDGISTKLFETFGEGYEIYIEDVEQDLQEPCFSIISRQGDLKPVVGTRYFKTSPFVVHYFPESKTNAKAEMQDMADRLYAELEYITVDGDLVRGTSMQHEISDGVLVFMVNYDAFVIKETTPIPTMEENVLNIGAKE